MQIPLCKPSIDNQELKIILNSLRTPWLTHGPYNVKFEKSFSNKFGSAWSLKITPL